MLPLIHLLLNFSENWKSREHVASLTVFFLGGGWVLSKLQQDPQNPPLYLLMHADKNGPSLLEGSRQLLKKSINGPRVNKGRRLMAFISAIGRGTPPKLLLECMV